MEPVSTLLFLIGLLNILMGLLVISRDSRRLQNVFFLLLSLSMAGWVVGIGAFLSVDSSNQALFWAKVYYAFPLLIAFAMYVFSKIFPDNKKISKNFILLNLVALLLIFLPLLLIPNFLTQGISYHDWGKEVIFNKVHYVIYSIYVLGAFSLGLYNVFLKIKNNTKYLKSQARFFFVGFLLTSMVGAIFNLILPWYGDYRWIAIGPTFTSIFLIAIGYSILRHGLFDIRPFVVRSLGYLITIGIMVTTFSFISIFSVRQFFEDNPNGFGQIVFNTIIFIFAVLTYPMLKRYFDHLTNRFFYRDGYDPQEFLDQLNKTIVNNIEIGILLRRTTKVIEENLKCSFVQIVVPSTESSERRVIGTKDIEYQDHELVYVRGRLVGLGQKIVKAEDLGAEEDELKKIYDKHDISLVVHLSATSYGQYQTIAYMIFGGKKSGNVYSNQDYRIIDILADQLVIAIQNSLRFEEIQGFNVTLQKKVTSATTKMRKTNEKLRAMDETKDEFISMASHQLRTPLTTVKGYLSMVLEGDVGDINDEQRKLLDQAFISSQRMVYLIADLLNVSRLRTGKFIIDPNETDLSEVVDTEVGQLMQQASNKNLKLVYNRPSNFPKLMIDETKTRQVIMNFIDNAMYYTQSGGKIEVKLEEDRNHIYFRVQDNGIGVPKDEQNHLFDKFYRAKNARSMRPDGTGLGLFMAKKVITAQGGNILFESKEGKGSTFGFSFNKKHLATKD